ncbi:MAG: response regulator, partial [Gammaproteobacteria bacterium]|nr:response regulator [Gammaproteobacteria bacterium]
MHSDLLGHDQWTRERMRVLLVEDSSDQAELIREMLALSSQYQFELQHEPHLHGGLDWLRDYTPDLVLLDLNLPDSRGLSGIQRMRDAAPGVPIIVLTNVEDEATALHALRVGAEDYLHKRQLAPELLVRAMRYAVERARVDEALRESEER